MEDIRLAKVEVLIQQRKFNDAEQILRDLLAADPTNVGLLSLLAEVNLQQEKFDVASTIINNAIGLSPANPQLLYIKSRIALQQDNYDEALRCIKQASQLDPLDADYFALWGNIMLAKKQFKDALELANKSLELDAENLLGLNTRSTALLKLNRTEESFNTIQGALRQNPMDPYTHASYGWGLLEKGDHKKALEHFREALKNNPNFEYAQAGMMEALKASNPVYRLFLKYAFFMGNLTAKYQWFVIIGFYVGTRVLRSIAASNEAIRPYLTPLIILLALVAFSTWVITPVSNLFLRFNRYGQFLLDKKEKMSSNIVAVSFALFVIGIALYFAMTDDKFLTIAVFGFAMMVPFSVMFSPAKYKYSLLIYAVGMAAVGAMAIGLTFSTGEIFNPMTVAFVFGFIAFQWIANYLMIAAKAK